MELFRALAVLAEPPSKEAERVAAALELGPIPEATEYTELFVFQLYPYASVYLGAEGMLGGEARDRIGGFWRALSLKPPVEPDHVALMLAFYARLCELATGESERVLDANWERARKAFLWEHLLSWLPVYLVKLDELAALKRNDLAAPFYRRWSEVLMKALLAEARATAWPASLPLHLRAAPSLVDPRRGEVGEFMQSLLAPVRSGMILTRADLSRAARRLGLGMRLGERAFILRALFGQDASGMLEWLAEEASPWVERHQAHASSLGEVARAWEGQARSAVGLLLELKREAGEIFAAASHSV
jgi:TorA maturation chaperone TorD